uniref:Cystatin domain-containing protein n=2 Tax=Aegilops tauschii TaxID=37682 RepID=A0A453E1K9_AEGTS
MGNSLLFAVAIVVIYAMAIVGAGSRVPIDINNPDVQRLGRWAVAEHENQVHDGIKFNKVVRAESDDDSELGLQLHLFIDATNGDGKDAKYEAVVDQIRGKPDLLDFKPAN